MIQIYLVQKHEKKGGCTYINNDTSLQPLNIQIKGQT